MPVALNDEQAVLANSVARFVEHHQSLASVRTDSAKHEAGLAHTVGVGHAVASLTETAWCGMTSRLTHQRSTSAW
jgi:hypothetical protein